MKRPEPFINAIEAGRAYSLSQPNIAHNVNMIRNPELAKLANQVKSPNRIAIPSPSSINTIIFCINSATSGVGSIICIIHSNHPGILLKIGVAQSPLVAASLAPLVVVCNHSNGIFTVEFFNQESSPIPLKSFDKEAKLLVASFHVSSPQSFAPASLSQKPPTISLKGKLQSTFPYLVSVSRKILRLSFVWKNSCLIYLTI